ncbi:Sec23/Sec24 trunk domain-containing protein [Phycomyces blakesleeanus]
MGGYQQPPQNTPYAGQQDPYYSGIVQGTAAMSLSTVPLRQDTPLFGQPPRIQDLSLPTPTPSLPSNIAATSSTDVQCSSVFNRSTLNFVPATPALLKKSKLPFSLIVEPFPSHVNVPVVTDTIVSRCTRCKTYINPFVKFVNMADWQCNMCGLDNEVPRAFDWDEAQQQHTDRWSRLELNHGCVDFVAPAEYMVRPPQPPVYVFVIDTSFQAVQTGMIGVIADAILASLDKLPNEDGRTKVAFVTADDAVAFYKLIGEEPEVLVVGDLSDIYLPRASSDLVVNLVESRSVVEDLLGRMKTMYQNTHSSTNCLGSALQAARKLLSPTGGKIVCFQASIPTVGDGAVKPTPDQKNSVTDGPLMVPSSAFYRTFATECTKSQVCADMFVIGGHYSDLATLNVIPRFTGGQTHFFPQDKIHSQADKLKLTMEIIAVLSEKVGLEAVMRTRTSPGLVCHAFHGNSTLRPPDIMALPNVPRDQSYCVDLILEEEIKSSVVYFQTALLYTTCFGERRIRVMNLCLPVTRIAAEVFTGADQFAIARSLCHQAIDKAVTSKLKDAREQLSKQTSDICNAYAKEVVGTGSSTAPLSMPLHLALLPLAILSIIKTDAFNDSPLVHIDLRSQSTVLLRILAMDAWVKYIIPRFYALHSMSPVTGSVDPTTGKFIMPTNLNLSSEKLAPHGCYMLENGQQIFLWIGKDAMPSLCVDLLDVPKITSVKSGQITSLPTLKSALSQQVNAIIKYLRTEGRKNTYYPSLYVVREDDDPVLRSLFLSHLVEDRQPNGPALAGSNQPMVSSGMSYFQWLGHVRSKCQP